MSGGGLYAAAGSTAAGLASGLSWIWRLGAVRSDPDPAACGFGSIEEATELSELVSSGGLASAVILAGDPGPASGPVPSRRRIAGIPRFSGGSRVRGEFTLFESGEPAVSSSLGAHAVDVGDVLLVGIDPDRDWGQAGCLLGIRGDLRSPRADHRATARQAAVDRLPAAR